MIDVYWSEQNDADVPARDDWLSGNEMACLQKLRFPKRRADWRLGRWTAKRALAACLHLPANPARLAEIEIRPASSGAPELFLAGKPAACAISLSHRSGSAVCALASGNVALGCDIELIEPHSQAFISDYFTTEEQELLTQVPASRRSSFTALLWSAKESALKALHSGLRLDTRSVIAVPQYAVSPQGTPNNAYEAAVWSGAFADDINWHPLRVRRINRPDFHGWWRIKSSFVQTVVAEPSPSPPIWVPAGHLARCLKSQKSPAALDSVNLEPLPIRGSANHLLLTARDAHVPESEDEYGSC